MKYGGKNMTITFEAIYESGVLKPLMPLTELKEKQRVQINLETNEVTEGNNRATLNRESENVVDRQRRQRLILEPEMMDDLLNNPENDLFEG